MRLNYFSSQTFEEFARKWNKPVHHFLYLHIYQEVLARYPGAKGAANMITFLFSSLLHELVLTLMCGGKIKVYFFALQMFQIPLIYIGRLSFFSKHPTFAVSLDNFGDLNIFFENVWILFLNFWMFENVWILFLKTF